MRRVELKTRSAYDDRDILRAVVGTSSSQGVNIEQMRTLVRILDKLDEGTDEIELEDRELELLVQKYDAFPFAIVHKDIVALRDELG